MPNPIKGEEIIVKKHLREPISQVKLIKKAYKELNDIIIELGKNMEKTFKGNLGKTAADINKLNKGLKESTQLRKKAITIDNEKLKIDEQIKKNQVKLAALDKNRSKQLAELSLRKQRANKLAKEEAILASRTSTEYEKQSIRLNRLRKSLKDNILTQGKGAKSTRRLAREVKNLDRRLKGVDAAAGQFQRNVGNYKTAVNGLTSSLARLGLGFGVFTLIRGSFNIIKKFDQAQADLASVLGVTRKEMTALTEQAKELGATTEFTATQVAELQKEYAKLGFTQKEIEDVTEATLQLASAAGTDLANAATITGSTLRAFGLDTSETQRVVDVMAKSFSSSSLDIEKFQVAMRSVAPVAKNAGLSIERTTALLGTLTDRGIDASTAGTGLRNVFLELSKRGITFEEAMAKINSATDKNAAALELFGKRGAVVGTILAETGADVTILEEKLLNAGGAAEEMADKQLDTLGGAIKLLQSAWEGLILRLNEGSGAGETLKDIIVFLAKNLETVVNVVILAVKVFFAYKVSVQAAAIATKIFGKAVSKIPFFAVITALITIVPLIVKWVKGLGAANDKLSLNEEILSRINKEFATQITSVVKLANRIRTAKEGTEEFTNAIEDWNKKTGKSIEIGKGKADVLRQLKVAYADVVKEIRKKIKLQVVENILTEQVTRVEQLKLERKELQKNIKDGEANIDTLFRLKEIQKEISTLVERNRRLGLQLGAAQIGQNEELIETEEEIIKISKKGTVEKIDQLAELRKLQELQAIKLENILIDQGKNEQEIREELRLQQIDFLLDQLILIRKLYGDESLEFQKTLLEFNRLSKKAVEEAVEDIEGTLAGLGGALSKGGKVVSDIEKANDEIIESFAKLRDESIAIFKEIADGRIAQFDRQIQAKEGEIRASENEIARLSAIGTADAAEAIKAEKVKQAQDKLDIERLEKKKTNLLIKVTALERASQLIGSGDQNPFKTAGAGIKAFLASLEGLYGGTDTTVADALGSPHLNTAKDQYIARLDGKEGVFTGDKMDRLRRAGLRTTNDITNAAIIGNDLGMKRNALNYKVDKGFKDTEIIKHMKEHTKAIENIQINETHIDVEKLMATFKKGNHINKVDYGRPDIDV